MKINKYLDNIENIKIIIHLKEKNSVGENTMIIKSQTKKDIYEIMTKIFDKIDFNRSVINE